MTLGRKINDFLTRTRKLMQGGGEKAIAQKQRVR